jgi:hypothetical protein
MSKRTKFFILILYFYLPLHNVFAGVSRIKIMGVISLGSRTVPGISNQLLAATADSGPTAAVQ